MKGVKLPVFNFSIQNSSSDAMDIFIDGSIVDATTQGILKDWFGDETSTSYKSFRDTVNKSEAGTFNIYINSGGGQLVEAMAIHDLILELQDKGKTVNTIGRGIIASAATYILMAGKSPSMSSNSWLMIHNVSGYVFGDVNEIESYANTMRKFNNAANDFYQNATGLSKTVIANYMNQESWFTASEAKDKGFIKQVAGETSFKNSIQPDAWQFQNTAVLNAYNSFTHTNNSPFMDTTKITDAITNGFQNFMEKLGLKDKSADAQVQAAMKTFSEGITNALKESKETGVALTEDRVKEIVNEITNGKEAKEGLALEIKNSVTEAMKNVATKEDVTEGLKNTVDKVSFKKEMDELTTSLINKIGGSTDPEKGDEGKDKNKDKNNVSKKKPTSKFAGFYDKYNNEN